MPAAAGRSGTFIFAKGKNANQVLFERTKLEDTPEDLLKHKRIKQPPSLDSDKLGGICLCLWVDCVAANGYTAGSARGAGVQRQGKSAGDHFLGRIAW